MSSTVKVYNNENTQPVYTVIENLTICVWLWVSLTTYYRQWWSVVHMIMFFCVSACAAVYIYMQSCMSLKEWVNQREREREIGMESINRQTKTINCVFLLLLKYIYTCKYIYSLASEFIIRCSNHSTSLAQCISQHSLLWVR